MPPLTAGMAALLYLIWVLMSWPLPTASFAPASGESAMPAVLTGTDLAADYLEIADWHLFGQGQRDVQASATVLAATPLPLKLLGTFWLAGAPESSYAIIQAGDGLQQNYRIGAVLPEDATLQSIEKTRVVLKHLQRLEILAFDPNPISLTAPNH